MRALIVLIDGVDEAAGMKEAIEEFVHKEVSVSGNRLVVTSRPEGVRLELYEDRFIVINLMKLTDEQQRKVRVVFRLGGHLHVSWAAHLIASSLAARRHPLLPGDQLADEGQRLLRSPSVPLRDSQRPGRDLRNRLPPRHARAPQD